MPKTAKKLILTEGTYSSELEIQFDDGKTYFVIKQAPTKELKELMEYINTEKIEYRKWKLVTE